MKYPAAPLGIAFLFATALAGCNRDAATSDPSPRATASEPPKSIFRPEFQDEAEKERQQLVPLEQSVGFPEGSALTDAAIARLGEIRASPQFAGGGAIVLRGHSDAGGNDEVNLRVSRQRAEAVRDWLLANGAAEERISMIPFGEQNPVAPNANPDGTPNEKGRAANRRVDIVIAVPRSTRADGEPSLAETLADRESKNDTESPAHDD